MEIGSHSATHPIFSSVTDEESWQELTCSRQQIEEGTGKSVTSFCFPNGMPGDYRPSQVRQLADAGYKCAVIADFGLVAKGTNVYHMPRMGMERKIRDGRVLQVSRWGCLLSVETTFAKHGRGNVSEAY